MKPGRNDPCPCGSGSKFGDRPEWHLLKSGQIIDATFVPVPIQRNGREDNAILKADAVPVDWGKTPAKPAHKDIDARWTKKGGQTHYGHKNHINIDKDTKLVAARTATPANVHDTKNS